MGLLGTTDWAAIGGIAAVVVAAFTGITAVITYLQHRHELAVTGWRNPIRLRRSSRLPAVPLPLVSALPRPAIFPHEAETHRSVYFQLFNRSASAQTIRFDERKTRIRAPRAARASLVTTGFGVEAHSGGYVSLIFRGDWAATGAWRGICLVRVRAVTTTGHTIRKRFLVAYAQPLEPSDIDTP